MLPTSCIVWGFVKFGEFSIACLRAILSSAGFQLVTIITLRETAGRHMFHILSGAFKDIDGLKAAIVSDQ